MAGKVVSVEFPSEKMTRKLMARPDTTAGDLAEMMRKKLATLNISMNCEDYGICRKSGVQLKEKDNILALKEDVFIYRQVSMRVPILLDSGDEHEIVIDCDATVAQAVAIITSQSWGLACSGQGCQLHLASKDKKSPSMKLELERKVSSYRLKPTDKLLFTAKEKEDDLWDKMKTSEQIACIIKSEQHETSKTMKFPLDTTVGEVVQGFLKKVDPNFNPSQLRKWRLADASATPLQTAMTLRDCQLKTPARLDLVEKGPEVVQWFGTDPTTLPMVDDNGFMVPEVLVRMKEMLMEMDALEMEGIFRKAGTETEMVTMKQQFINGEKIIVENPHSVATVLKRWYKELPKRLLVDMDPAIALDDRVLRSYDYLNDCYRHLLLWLTDILVQTLKHEQKNLMDSKNIAIVWGPGLVGSTEADGNPFLGLTQTKTGITTVERLLSFFLDRELPRTRHDSDVLFHTVPEEEEAYDEYNYYEGEYYGEGEYYEEEGYREEAYTEEGYGYTEAEEDYVYNDASQEQQIEEETQQETQQQSQQEVQQQAKGVQESQESTQPLDEQQTSHTPLQPDTDQTYTSPPDSSTTEQENNEGVLNSISNFEPTPSLDDWLEEDAAYSTYASEDAGAYAYTPQPATTATTSTTAAAAPLTPSPTTMTATPTPTPTTGATTTTTAAPATTSPATSPRFSLSPYHSGSSRNSRSLAASTSALDTKHDAPSLSSSSRSSSSTNFSRPPSRTLASTSLPPRKEKEEEKRVRGKSFSRTLSSVFKKKGK